MGITTLLPIFIALSFGGKKDSVVLFAFLLLSSSTYVWAQNVTTFATVGMGPLGIAFDSSDSLYVANSFSKSISKITPGGIVNNSYITGLDPRFIAFDSVDNTYVSIFFSIWKYSSNGILVNATFGGPLDFNSSGIKFDTLGTLYVYDYSNGRIRKISSAGVLDPTSFVTGLPLKNTGGLSFDLDGNLYVTNVTNGAILKVNTVGVVSTFATGFNGPYDVVVDCVGTLYVSNVNGNSISKVTAQGVVSTYVSGLNNPRGLALDTRGNLYVANFLSNNVSKIVPQEGAAHGANFGDVGCPGLVKNVTTFAKVGLNPLGLAFDGSGNLFVANGGSSSISKITPGGGIVDNTYITGLTPWSIAFDSVGNMYVSDFGSQTIRKYDSAGILINATFGGSLRFIPQGIKIDINDALYVSDVGNGLIRKISPVGVLDPNPFISGVFSGGLSFDLDGNLFAANYTTILKVNTAGAVSIFASGFKSYPYDVVVDCVGALYVSDDYGNSISKVTPQGNVSTYVAGLKNPRGLSLDSSGNLYVANYGSNNVTKIEPPAGTAHGLKIGDVGCATKSATTKAASPITLTTTHTTTAVVATATTKTTTKSATSTSTSPTTAQNTVTPTSSSSSSTMATTLQSTSPLSLSENVASVAASAIIGGVVGGLVLLVVVIVVVVCLVRRNRSQENSVQIENSTSLQTGHTDEKATTSSYGIIPVAASNYSNPNDVPISAPDSQYSEAVGLFVNDPSALQ